MSLFIFSPPGTGKTTICKALAQKVFIRNCDRYTGGVLLEINSHSLFSKWFSESGKLVMKLFDHINEIAEDEECFVAVLIDEVESITASRSSASRRSVLFYPHMQTPCHPFSNITLHLLITMHTSNEPGDAVRVVNAVLTSLDALRRRPNVLVLCTSNMVESIDAVRPHLFGHLLVFFVLCDSLSLAPCQQAFRDRVDLQIYLGPPPVLAR